MALTAANLAQNGPPAGRQAAAARGEARPVRVVTLLTQGSDTDMMLPVSRNATIPRLATVEEMSTITTRGAIDPPERYAQQTSGLSFEPPMVRSRSPRFEPQPVVFTPRDRAHLIVSGQVGDPTIGVELANTVLRMMNLAGMRLPVNGRLSTPEARARINEFRRQQHLPRGSGRGTTIDVRFIDALESAAAANPASPLTFTGFGGASDRQTNAARMLTELHHGDPIRYEALRARLRLTRTGPLTLDDADKVVGFIERGRDNVHGPPMTDRITTLLNHGQPTIPGAWTYEMARGVTDFMLDPEPVGRDVRANVLWSPAMERAARGYLPVEILRATVSVESDGRNAPENEFGAMGWAQLTHAAISEYRIMPNNEVVYIHNRTIPRGARLPDINNMNDHLRVAAFHLTRLYDEAAVAVGYERPTRPEQRTNGSLWDIAHSGYNSGFYRVGPYAGTFPARNGETPNHVVRVRYMTAIFKMLGHRP